MSTPTKSKTMRNFLPSLPPQLLLLLPLLFLLACGGPPAQNEPAVSADNNPLELTDEVIGERINEAFVRNIPEETNSAEPIGWGFDPDEPKEITVVDKQIQGNRATIVLDIKTTTSPRSNNPRYLAGQIRTEWQLTTGWVLRRWEITKTENISMKYRKLPKPSPSQTPGG